MGQENIMGRPANLFTQGDLAVPREIQQGIEKQLKATS